VLFHSDLCPTFHTINRLHLLLKNAIIISYDEFRSLTEHCKLVWNFLFFASKYPSCCVLSS